MEEGYAMLCAVRRMRQGLSDLYIVLCKVRLRNVGIKREVVIRARRITSEKLRAPIYRRICYES